MANDFTQRSQRSNDAKHTLNALMALQRFLNKTQISLCAFLPSRLRGKKAIVFLRVVLSPRFNPLCFFPSLCLSGEKNAVFLPAALPLWFNLPRLRGLQNNFHTKHLQESGNKRWVSRPCRRSNKIAVCYTFRRSDRNISAAGKFYFRTNCGIRR